MVRVSERDRRALKLAGAALLVACAWSGLRPESGALPRTRAAAAQETALLARERGLIETYASTAESSAHGPPRGTIVANDPMLASARLAELMEMMAEGAGVRLDALEPWSDGESRSGLTAVGVVAAGEGDFEGVLRWLAQLEEGSPVIAIEEFELRVLGHEDGRERLAFSVRARAYAATEGEW